MPIKALLMDLDGVLVDAVALHEEAFLQAVRTEGHSNLTQQEHQATYSGLPTKVKLARLVALGKLNQRYVDAVAQAKQALTQEYIHTRIHPDPSRINLLQHFNPHFKLGCVTNCVKKTAREMLERAGLLRYVEACLVTNEDAEPKPSPMPYRLACGILEVSPEEALVFEDHDLGMTAAFNAGCCVTQVKTWEELTVKRVWEAIHEAEAHQKEPVD